MRPRGPGELDRRRLRAVALLSQGLAPHVVAERLGVDARSVRRWKRWHRQETRPRLGSEGEDGADETLPARERRASPVGSGGP